MNGEIETLIRRAWGGHEPSAAISPPCWVRRSSRRRTRRGIPKQLPMLRPSCHLTSPPRMPPSSRAKRRRTVHGRDLEGDRSPRGRRTGSSPGCGDRLDTSLLDASFVADRVGPTVRTRPSRRSSRTFGSMVNRYPSWSGSCPASDINRLWPSAARAAKALGRPVRAGRPTLTDAELVLAQASENLARRDLSYIERAFFAANMADAGISREVIEGAMGADDAQISRYIKVARSIPPDILAAIGPAPKVGRPRWDELPSVSRSPIFDVPARRSANLVSPTGRRRALRPRIRRSRGEGGRQVGKGACLEGWIRPEDRAHRANRDPFHPCRSIGNSSPELGEFLVGRLGRS